MDKWTNKYTFPGTHTSKIWICINFAAVVSVYQLILLSTYINITALKVFVIGVFLVCIFLNSGWIRTRKTPNMDTCHVVYVNIYAWMSNYSNWQHSHIASIFSFIFLVILIVIDDIRLSGRIIKFFFRI